MFHDKNNVQRIPSKNLHTEIPPRDKKRANSALSFLFALSHSFLVLAWSYYSHSHSFWLAFDCLRFLHAMISIEKKRNNISVKFRAGGVTFTCLFDVLFLRFIRFIQTLFYIFVVSKWKSEHKSNLRPSFLRVVKDRQTQIQRVDKSIHTPHEIMGAKTENQKRAWRSRHKKVKR